MLWYQFKLKVEVEVSCASRNKDFVFSASKNLLKLKLLT